MINHEVLTMRWARQVLATILVLSLISLMPRVARAEEVLDPIATMVARVSPAVVRVVAVQPPQPGDDKAEPSLAGASAGSQTTNAIGSGFIIDPSGYIATNKHVIVDGTSIIVITANGERYQASIVGMPAKSDIALLRIDAGRKLPSVSFGDSDKMRVGDTVVAIGSPYGFDNSATAGIISAVNRDIMESPFDDYFQTDAAINHGNSGGPLFNRRGEVIGMNSVIFAPGTGSVGLGFAIPSNDLQFVYGRLMKTGKIMAGMLPINTQPVTWMLQQALGAPDLKGALVTAVNDDDEAMLQGKVRPGDVILNYNGHVVWDPRDLARKAAWTPVGSKASLEICRSGIHQTVDVTIQAWPEAPPIVLKDPGQSPLGLELVAGHGDEGEPTVVVASVDPDGTAADSGIKKGDIIVEVQQTPVTDPDQALRIFWVQSAMRHGFAAVLVEHDKKRSWIPLSVPN
jgi:serine protease Do